MRFPSLLAIAGLAACGGLDLSPDPATYTVEGRVLPQFAGDPLPAPSAMRVVVFDGWEDDADPFPEAAEVLADVPLDVDGSFHAQVTEDDYVGVIAALTVDDAPGEPDRLVATINDRRVNEGVADLEAYAIDRARLDGWRASPALAGRDPEAEGAALITFLDRDRRPAAGVDALAWAITLDRETSVFYLDATGTAIVPDATATTASGLVLVMGAPGFDIAGTDAPALDDLTHTHVGCGLRPGAIFVETVSALALVDYTVSGRVAPLVAGDPQGALDVRVLDAWERTATPLADDVPVLATVTPDGTGAFSVMVTEDEDALIAAVLTDDAVGAADLLVPTISTATVGTGTLTVATIAHDRVAGWQASPVLAPHDLLAEGAALITYVDASGRPAAGVIPSALFGGRPYFLSADGASIAADATATTASGRVLLFGQPFLVAGTRTPDGPPTHTADWVGTRPGAITNVTLPELVQP